MELWMLASQNNVIYLFKCYWKVQIDSLEMSLHLQEKIQQIPYYLTYTRANVKGHLVIFQGRNKSAAFYLHLLSIYTFSSLLRTVLAFALYCHGH